MPALSGSVFRSMSDALTSAALACPRDTGVPLALVLGLKAAVDAGGDVASDRYVRVLFGN